MREIVARVSREGRVTLPAEVRRRLGIATPGKIAFVFDPDGAVSLRRLSPTFADVKGSVPALPGETADLEEEIADAIAAHLDRPR
ncbi:MAG TPA: AbrB/MazE/SpoVT family DNA-binding domain-containing protein [Thermomicrobiales bacterium]|nr:AbrB/MazE/SpoVT family DNA-binding domain-containing protein [Thermomicrobiales bacterium]